MMDVSKREKCFITGGSGFVGRNLIPLLVREGYEVHALIRSKTAADIVANLGAIPVSGEITKPETLINGMCGCSTVFHLAAIVDIKINYDEMYDVNVRGTESVIQAALNCGVEKLIDLSTVCVVLDGIIKFNIDEKYTIKSTLPGVYSRTKAIAEKRILESNSSALQCIVVRSTLVWGRGDTSVLPKIMDFVNKGQFMWISGGNYKIPTTHVTNLCYALMLTSKNGKGGEIYYITDGKPVVFREFIGQLIESQGVNTPRFKSSPRWLALIFARTLEAFHKLFKTKQAPSLDVEFVYTMGTAYTVNDSKARTHLGYNNIIEITEGLKQMNQSSQNP